MPRCKHLLVDIDLGTFQRALTRELTGRRAPLAAGFCYYNHVAVAARAALGSGARKVAIVDWDVHHGGMCTLTLRNPAASAAAASCRLLSTSMPIARSAADAAS